jgi:cob(I)alamin adenosyltransferase
MGLRVAPANENAKEHAGDVGVEDCGALAERKASNGSARVGADPFERAERVPVGWELPAKPRHRFAGDRMQAPGPNVVAEGPPRLGHLLDRSVGQVPKRRVLFEPLVILRQDAIHLGLLKHHFRHEDVIRVVRAPPGQIAAIHSVPGEESRPKSPPLRGIGKCEHHEVVKIYTKTGDTGETSLFDNTRVLKSDARVDAYGEVDELNACLGAVRAAEVDRDVSEALERIQKDLFALGARLADPSARIAERVTKAAISASDIERLEQLIDSFESELPPLRQFILPGGSQAGATLHLARTVCRRAERRVVGLGAGHVEPMLVVYLNRLSDLLFVMARAVNHRSNVPEVEW